MKEKLNFTLDPEAIKIIDKVADDLHISRSAALNYLILDYDNFCKKVKDGYIMVRV